MNNSLRFDTTHNSQIESSPNRNETKRINWTNENIHILNQPHMQFAAPKSDEEIRFLTSRDTNTIDLATIQNRDFNSMLRDEKKYRFLGNRGIKLNP